jgi:hypothetical protein
MPPKLARSKFIRPAFEVGFDDDSHFHHLFKMNFRRFAYALPGNEPLEMTILTALNSSDQSILLKQFSEISLLRLQITLS